MPHLSTNHVSESMRDLNQFPLIRSLPGINRPHPQAESCINGWQHMFVVAVCVNSLVSLTISKFHLHSPVKRFGTIIMTLYRHEKFNPTNFLDFVDVGYSCSDLVVVTHTLVCISRRHACIQLRWCYTTIVSIDVLHVSIK